MYHATYGNGMLRKCNMLSASKYAVHNEVDTVRCTDVQILGNGTLISIIICNEMMCTKIFLHIQAM